MDKVKAERKYSVSDKLETEIDKLIAEHGKRKVKKAVEAVFGRWRAGETKKTKKDEEYERIADDIWQRYPGDGAWALTIKNIVRLLKTGIKPEVLFTAADRYRTRLRAESPGRAVRLEYVYKSHNFYGQKSYWRDFVTEKEIKR